MCWMAAPVERAASYSRGPRGVARSLRRASGWRGRPRRPVRAGLASGPHPSGGASRVSPHRGLSDVMYPSEVLLLLHAGCPPLRDPPMRVPHVHAELRGRPFSRRVAWPRAAVELAEPYAHVPTMPSIPLLFVASFPSAQGRGFESHLNTAFGGRSRADRG